MLDISVYSVGQGRKSECYVGMVVDESGER